MKHIILAFLLIFTAPVFAQSMPPVSFSEMRVDEDTGTEYYVMYGGFEPSTKAVVANFFRQFKRNDEINIVMASPGGYANDLQDIVAIVLNYNNVTFYSQYGNCISACAIMATAGTKMLGTFHFHAIHRNLVIGGESRKVLGLIDNEWIFDYLRARGVSDYVALMISSEARDLIEIGIQNGHTLYDPFYATRITEAELAQRIAKLNANQKADEAADSE